MNVSDTERVASQLAAEGYRITDDEASADIVIFNTCSVREKAEQKLYTRIGEIRKASGDEKRVGVMGCVAQLEGDSLFHRRGQVDFVIGTRATGRVGEAVRATLGGAEAIIDLGEREPDHAWDTEISHPHSPFVAFLPIIEGCNKFCTYCIVPFSRGRETSLSAELLLSQAARILRAGAKEIHLIGQNVNSYRPVSAAGLEGLEGATPFSKLLRAMALTETPRVKFATSFPRDFHPDIIDAIDDHPNLCNWIHLPVQSGSDRILSKMKRGHTIERYRKLVDKIRNGKRMYSLTTDLIVGFPGETERDFEESLELARYCKFDGGYIFKYSPRPGTPAFELADDVSEDEKTQRFLALEAVIRESQSESMRAMIGNRYEVLLEKASSRTLGGLSGHTTCHRVVNVEAPKERLGEIVTVEIDEAKVNSLSGRIV